MTRFNLPHLLAPALSLTMALAPSALRADMVGAAIDGHILPGFHALAETSTALSEAAENDCNPESAALRAAYGAGFDAWVQVSHLRFGPTEADNRAFALAFWPDSRGKTPKALQALIRNGDPIVTDPDAYSTVSIAARGFYALEFLLYDTDLQQAGTAAYRCALTRAITRDIAATSAAIDRDWTETFADEMRQPGDRYHSDAEIKQELFKALDTGLQILIDMRLGRPLGTYDKPRPNRAEAYRSGRSLRHVVLSLEALEDLALILSADIPDLKEALAKTFATVRAHAERLEDPVLAGVAAPGPRLRIEALQQDLRNLREEIGTTLGPALGVEVGFNALDGD
ncbi:imelysin family protein [Phycobacter sp. K97]|uniref:imelysin family protein n=1 Tax=Phycobacter sedimenti TaxID=3133977 RepID=UPI00311FFE80